MAETQEKAPVAQGATVGRRGIGTARGTQRLKFTHEIANKMNGLFQGHLDSVQVSKILIGEDKTGMPSFNGLEIPRIALVFASNEDDANRRHYATLSFTAVESNAETIPGGKSAWKVDAVFDWFKHILDVYVLKGKEMTPEMEAALSLSFVDFDEEGQYVSVDAEQVIAGWTTLFENFANILETSKDGKPAYKTADGKFIPVWFKLLRYTKSKKGWTPVNNGDLAFPTFVGEGCVEIFRQNVAPSIRVDSVKEAIRPMNIEKAKAPNMPQMPAGAAPTFAGVAPMDGGFPGGYEAGLYNEAAEEQPF